MIELSDELYDSIKRLSKQGNNFCEKGQYVDALSSFNAALELVPLPKTDWDTSTWLYVALGDVYFAMNDFEHGKNALFDAMNCPDGQTNPFIYLRLGQCLFELQELDKCEEFLMRAYMLEGKKIFKGENKKYINFLKEKYSL